jgi:hypothetical protein
MDSADVIRKLKDAPNRRVVADATGVRYDYLCKLVYGLVKNPGSAHMDKLRNYFQQQGRPQ